MASIPAPRASTLSPARGAALVAGGCGVVAALAILLVTHGLVIATGFLAVALLITGALLAFRRLFPSTRAEAAEPDWSVARTLAASSPEAVAITDRAGRLVCANRPVRGLVRGLPDAARAADRRCRARGARYCGAHGTAGWRGFG